MLLLSGLWPGLVGALALGLGLGWATPRPHPLALIGLGAAALLALAVAAAGLVPGRPGLWLESGAAMLAVYGLGCALGAGARRVRRNAPAKP